MKISVMKTGTGYRRRYLLLATAAAVLLCDLAQGGEDPLNSPAWQTMRERFFKGAALKFDDRVMVSAPRSAEDALAVPVMVSAPALPGVQEIVVIADLNPIQKILSLQTPRAVPAVSFRFKVEQSTPIRAAMRTADGTWHVGGVWLSAAGGGCTTPSGGSRGLWHGEVGQMNGRLWHSDDGRSERLRLRVIHPMDTGLAGAIPAFYIDRITVRDAHGAELAILNTFEPVAENPVFGLDLLSRDAVSIDGHDTQGDAFAAQVRP
jgi:sulfur-oxidizing protein SoxY